MVDMLSQILFYKTADVGKISSMKAKQKIKEKWLKEYNEERPHESLGNMTPVEYLESKQPETSILLRH